MNILTGANNNGKSTLFKAMKIFTDGFTNGDFPVIDLQKVLPECGYFSDLLNFNSKQKHLKVGFRYFSEQFKSHFEVIYQFVEGEHPNEARFASVQVKKDSKLLMTLYHYDILYYEDKERYDVEKISFKSILEDSNPGQIVFSIDLKMLKQLIPVKMHTEHERVFDMLEKQFGEQWVGELFIEEKFYDNCLVAYSRISEELFFDLFRDYFCNLYNHDNKYPIFNDSDGEEVEHEYQKKCSEIGYQDFIRDCFQELFDELSAQIRFFYIKRLYHIELKDAFYSRIIPINAISFKVLVTGYNENKEKY
ncbi:MAG TPA: ATP-binding protein, partial [Bacteroidales bacterium]|nr:ATP-binding protein [Bacteroidales bacterium]